MSAPKNKYSETITEVKKGLTVILAEAQLLLSYEIGLSQEGITELNEIKSQVFRIGKLVEKIK